MKNRVLKNCFSALGIALLFLACSDVARAQTWNAAPAYPGSSGAGTALLLTDGTVLVHQSCTPNWYKLTPDASGNYTTGSWSGPIAMQSTFGPLYFASAVLPDGKLIASGGEYNLSSCAANTPVDSNLAALYDPATNTWSAIPSPPFANVGDAQSVVLPNGTFLLGNLNNTQIAQYNEGTNTWSAFTPIGKADSNSEEGWTLLPDGTLLTVDTQDGTNSEIYNSITQAWSSAGSTIASLGNNGGLPIVPEMGPAILRPDQTVYATGASGQNATYTFPSASWAASTSFPVISGTQQEIADGPASLLPDGNVLVATSGFFNKPTHFFEWDGTTLNPAPGTPNAPSIPSFVGRMLLLPTGQVLFTDGSNDVEIYSPLGTYQAAWQPVITTAPPSVGPGSTYPISGKQFNGLSQAVAYGDDAQMATNYPLVRITNNGTGDVFYCRTHDHSTMGVATGSTIVSTNFDTPSGLELGPSKLVVVANGIPSAAVDVDVEAATSLTYTGATTGQYNSPATVSAVLKTSSGGTPISGETVMFQLNPPGSTGTEICYGVTNGAGLASCTIIPYEVPATYTLTATFAGDSSYGGSTTSTSFIETQIPQTITFIVNAPASAVYNTMFSVAAVGGGSGNSVTYSSAGGCSNSGSTYTMTSGTISCSVIANQAGNPYYSAAPTVTETVIAVKAPQTVMFTINAPATAVFGTSFTVAATASSGLPVVYQSSGACSNVGAVYTMTSGTGTCSVIATQPGDMNYFPATPVTETVKALKANQTITFKIKAPPSANYETAFEVTAIASSGLPVTLTAAGVCTTSDGATFSIIKPSGTCTVIANQPGNSNYNAAPTVTETVLAVKAIQAVSFTGAPVFASKGTKFTVTATSSAGIVATITASGACSILGTTVTMTSATGTCNLTANWAGNTNYQPRSATQTTVAQK